MRVCAAVTSIRGRSRSAIRQLLLRSRDLAAEEVGERGIDVDEHPPRLGGGLYIRKPIPIGLGESDCVSLGQRRRRRGRRQDGSRHRHNSNGADAMTVSTANRNHRRGSEPWSEAEVFRAAGGALAPRNRGVEDAAGGIAKAIQEGRAVSRRRTMKRGVSGANGMHFREERFWLLPLRDPLEAASAAVA